MKQVYEKLLRVQTELKAPKNLHNNFGNYNYRNAEGILEAVKPICKEVKALILLSDEVINVGTSENRGETFTQVTPRNYVRATATFIDVESGEIIEVKANAREEETKKGMDGSQITGASSSYARKYALNGLLAIDDTKDSDTTNDGSTNDMDAKTVKVKPVQEVNTTISLKCSECGKEIDEKVAKYSKSRYGKELCRDCQFGKVVEKEI